MFANVWCMNCLKFWIWKENTKERKKGWCDNCDAEIVEGGKKCDNCGVRNYVAKIKKPSTNQILNDLYTAL